jgi:hypothetical protein
VLYFARECRVDAIDFLYSHSQNFINVENSGSHHGLEAAILDVNFFILTRQGGMGIMTNNLPICPDTSSKKWEIIFIFV